jgi:3-dehydroquinate dehydratase / shikimate dehydrogenase
MSMPLLCVTVTAPTMAELRRRRDDVAEADLVELRLDTVCDPDVAGALSGRRRPVVVTCRPEWEGGRFQGSEDERRRILAEALRLGAEYVDIESRANFTDLLRVTSGRRVVLSYHDFQGVPDNLPELVSSMRSTGAELVKVAVQARTLSDCVPLLELGVRAQEEPGLILIGMGPCGLATRVLAGRFGSRWTYAGSQQQLGQISATALVGEYRFRGLRDHSALYGVVGSPISHSISPAMHNAAFSALDLDAVYLPFPAVTADDFVTFARALGVKGASVTIPHKVTMIDRVDQVDDVARRVGAINTVRVDEGRWLGTNTDVQGFLNPLVARVALGGLRVSILGSGGAARAVAVALVSQGCRVRVHGRSLEHAERVAALTSTQAAPFPPEPGTWDLLVNCTPVGMYPNVNETPMDASQLTGQCVYDLIYNPMDTQLLRDAARAGCQTIGGLEMLVAQAHEQFEWWTGVRPPAGVMQEAARTRLGEFKRDENYVV